MVVFKPDEFAGLDAFVLADPLASFDAFDEELAFGVVEELAEALVLADFLVEPVAF